MTVMEEQEQERSESNCRRRWREFPEYIDGDGDQTLLSLNGCDWYREVQVRSLEAVTAWEGGLLIELLSFNLENSS